MVHDHEVIISGEGNKFHSLMFKTIILASLENLCLQNRLLQVWSSPSLWSGRIPCVDTSPQTTQSHALHLLEQSPSLPLASKTLITLNRFSSTQATIALVSYQTPPCFLGIYESLLGQACRSATHHCQWFRDSYEVLIWPLSWAPAREILNLIPDSFEAVFSLYLICFDNFKIRYCHLIKWQFSPLNSHNALSKADSLYPHLAILKKPRCGPTLFWCFISRGVLFQTSFCIVRMGVFEEDPQEACHFLNAFYASSHEQVTFCSLTHFIPTRFPWHVYLLYYPHFTDKQTEA